SDAALIWHGLTHGAGLAMVIASAVAGVTTLALVTRRRYELARVGAALAVAAIIAGWAAAQAPTFLPDLTIQQAAAGRSTLIATIIAVAVGAIVLVPALVLLFGLFLHGQFDRPPDETPPPASAVGTPGRHAAAAIALIGGIAGTPLLVLADNGWLKALGVA